MARRYIGILEFDLWLLLQCFLEFQDNAEKTENTN